MKGGDFRVYEVSPGGEVEFYCASLLAVEVPIHSLDNLVTVAVCLLYPGDYQLPNLVGIV